MSMHRWLWLLSCLLTVSLLGCSAEYYARRAERREQRIAAREARRQAQVMAVCGDAQGAFERGHNAGMARQAMDTSWVAQCPYQFQQQQANAYLAGYQQGAARAPAHVVVPAPYPQGVAIYGGGGGGFTSCRFSSDCGPSRSCRQWGNAGSVCMGFGGPGDPCWFSSDCVSGSCDLSARLCR